jgi:uncharacterized repeat protein (TIGR01451 family)
MSKEGIMRREWSRRPRAFGFALISFLLPVVLAVPPVGAGGGGDGSQRFEPLAGSLARGEEGEEEGDEELLERNAALVSRLTAGDVPIDIQTAGLLRVVAVRAAKQLEDAPSPGPATFDNPWRGLGPNPIVQSATSDGSFTAMSGRIGALAIRPSNGQFILGGAQGGIWLYNQRTGVWTPRTDNLPSLAIGAIAVAPSNDAIVYAGTGEGALSGDSYFGNGILKSTDGGTTWAHISGNYFQGVAVSSLVVDPGNADHLFVAIARGRGGARRVTPPVHSRYGVWESTDGGATWTLRKEAAGPEINPACAGIQSCGIGATDLEMDPQNAQILYSSFWGEAIYKSTNGGATWAPIMNGLPAGDFGEGQTRFSIDISHPARESAVLYAGFSWTEDDEFHPARVFKSTNAGASWTMLPTGDGGPKGVLDSVEDYCGAQCFYDNVIEVDPTDPDVVFAGGQFGYGLTPASGGIFRSDDGGATWLNLGWNQHPDFHAVAFDPKHPTHVLVGSDGGVWYSPDDGGRMKRSDPLSSVDWQNLNGTVDPATAGVTHRTGLAIAQYTSIATVPTVAPGLDSERFWGGTQDNGTQRKSVNSQSWFDVAGGDGGQVLVDPTVDSCGSLGPSCYVYGTFFGISPYRFTDGGGFFTAQSITGGINLSDRSTFYIPIAMNRLQPDQLFLGTYRLYRTDNARAAQAGDVEWKPISPDLTSGCTGPAPNGARGCFISAIGVGGGSAVYTGSEDGYVYVSTDAQVSPNPTWRRLDRQRRVLPNRPVTQFAVDRSNYRIAYASFAGFNAATPSTPGHVFKTTNGGSTWTDISGNLPDSPVNSVILDPSFPNTLYAGTDVGPFVTFDGGAHWGPLGSGFPVVSIWQLDLDTSHRILAAGTHGRGAFRLADSAAVPSLVLSKVDAGVPVGPGSDLTYTITLRNIGNADATGVRITDPVPPNTSFVSAGQGGTNVSGTITWSALTVPKGGSVDVTFTVKIAPSFTGTSIRNDGYAASSAQGPSTTGSPTITPIAPPFDVTLTPAAQTDGARAGDSVTYPLTVENVGFNSDSYTLSSSGGAYPVSFFDATCTTPQATTPTLLPGDSTDVCVKVDVPAGAANGDTSTATITATSVASPTVSGTATVTTIAVTVDTLLVDGDGQIPDVQSYYIAALNDAGVAFDSWDLSGDSHLPLGYLNAHKNVVWFTGNSYPGPITPYEDELTSFLDGGGRLFVSGQDVLDQAAGTTAFVHDYLHVTWDGSETQNDVATDNVHGLAGTLTNGIGAVPLDHGILGNEFEDQITPNGSAVAIFTDDATQADALSFSGSYKVVFLAFPFEAYGTAPQKADVISRAVAFFGP